MLKVLAVTGGRADWGYVAPPLTLMRKDSYFDAQLAITGQHLAAEGSTSLAALEAEGFADSFKVDLQLDDYSPAGIGRSLGRAVNGFTDVLAQVRPHLMLVVGDRYEILGAVSAALIARVPVAHLCGGDITEGAMDDAIRHSITKMSHLHFVTNEWAADCVRQLGEDPERIYNVGSTSLDRLRGFIPANRDDFFKAISLRPRARNIVVTFHPVTLAQDGAEQCRKMLTALDDLGDDVGLIFTGVNADPSRNSIASQIKGFVGTHANSVFVENFGAKHYLSALHHIDLMVGNSSSGLLEGPSFRRPAVNIGERQDGRIRAGSVIDTAPERNAIRDAIQRAFTLDCANVVNPYGDGRASERIVSTLRDIGDPARLLKKRFCRQSRAAG